MADPELNTGHYINAKRFPRNDVGAAIIALERPDAVFFLNSCQGATEAEFVAPMPDKVIRFAPAIVGRERSYGALHRALARALTRPQNQEPAANNPW